MNASCNDSGKLIPYSAFTAGTPALPAFYWDVYSSEQRIKELCKELKKLAEYGTYLAETIDEIQAITPDEFKAYQQEVRETVANLRKEIYELSVGTMSWNVQHGNYTTSKQSQRDMFNDLSVHAITVKTLNSLDMTVKDLADCGLNVRGLAVMSYSLIDKFDIPSYFEEISESEDDSAFNISRLNTAKVDADTGTVYIPEKYRE